MLTEVWKDMVGNPDVRADVSRFGAQVINGIGFLGAGTIIVTRKQEVKGVTTAAGLWASACVGLAIGAGFYEAVLRAFLAIFLSIRVLTPLENAVIENSRNMNLYVEFDSLDAIGAIIAKIKSQKAHIYEVDIDHGHKENMRNPSAVFSIRLEQRNTHTRVIAAIAELENVRSIDEIM
jgi:putative Mg2+ transporter-C (MgtC) family protein